MYVKPSSATHLPKKQTNWRTIFKLPITISGKKDIGRKNLLLYWNSAMEGDGRYQITEDQQKIPDENCKLCQRPIAWAIFMPVSLPQIVLMNMVFVRFNGDLVPVLPLVCHLLFNFC